MQVLAFDPGYGKFGWGAVSAQASPQSFKLLGCGTIETKANQEMSLRMQTLYGKLCRLIQDLQPDCIGMERLYFSKNRKTAAGVYQAQGVLLAAAGQAKYSVKELEPKLIKRVLTGSGTAGKQQVMQMTCKILSEKNIISSDDSADAVACAIACYFHFQSIKNITDKK